MQTVSQPHIPLEKTACVFGGTGFLGRYIVQALCRAGWRVKVPSRSARKGYFLRPYGVVGQVVPMTTNPQDPESLRQAIAGSDAVINLLGVLAPKRRQDFFRIHRDTPRQMAEIAAAEGAARFVHVSAMGVDRARSTYARSKSEGEAAVLEAFPPATILRPGVVFGPEDGFFNFFARMARISPFLPLIGGGKTRLQPVYVGDVARAVATVLDKAPEEVGGRTYVLAGPEIYSLKDIYALVMDQIQIRRPLIPVPWALAKAQGFVFENLPGRILTRDQVETLKTDNILHPGERRLEDLGIEPTLAELILPGYLDKYRPGGRFADTHHAQEVMGSNDDRTNKAS